MTTLALAIFALISSLSRGFISIIDRYQMGYRKESSLKINFYNNFFAALLATFCLVWIIKVHQFTFNFNLSMWFNLFVYALLVQGVAYGYSYIYKHWSVMDAVMLSNSSNMLIPVALFVTTGYFSLFQYSFSVISTVLIVLVGMISLKNKMTTKDPVTTNRYGLVIKSLLVIVPIIVIQAGVSPLLVSSVKSNVWSLMVFTLITIYLRLIITFVSLAGKLRKSKPSISRKSIKQTPLLIIFIYTARSVLTILAQLTFTLSTSSGKSGIAWIFLNMTSLYSVALSSLILKEKLKTYEVILIVAITGLSILGSLG